MLTKKKRKMLKVSLIVIIILLIFTVLAFLYLKTDMFKSDESLFFKYLGNNYENLLEIQKMVDNEEFNNIINLNNYTENIEITANYLENYGTTSESNDNIINKLKLNINGEVDDENNYKNYNIELSNQNDQNIKMEVIENSDTYQISFPQLFAQGIQINDISSVFDSLDNQFTIDNIQDIKNNLNTNFLENIVFNENELESLKNKYIGLIELKTKDYKFSKKSNQKISINEKSFNANEYILTMTKEEFNNLYIDILTELKNDEIIISKIDNLQKEYNLGLQNINTYDFKDLFFNWIDETIDTINRNNIGTDEVRIIVYEYNGDTISTIIETTDYEIDFDNLHGAESFSEISIKGKNEESIVLTLSKNDNTTKFTIENINENNDKETIFGIEEKNVIESKECQKNISINYQDEKNKIEVNIDRKININNNVNIKEVDEKNIVLDDLEKEQLNIVINTISDKVLNKINEVSQNIDIVNDIQKILKNIGLKTEIEEIVSEGITEAEKNRYNSRFEILTGEELSSEDILRIISEIENSISNLVVESSTKLKIEINEQEKDEELSEKLKTFIENNKNKKYNADLEYDETTGLVKYVVLTINEGRN